jgi:hypothetical protein
MTSSISHSNRRVPVRAMKLLAVAVAAWMACAAYTLWLNPEVRFYSRMSALQDDWSRKMDREHGNKVVVFGGSSCMFSIIGEQLLEKYNLPAVNRGLGAALGVKIPMLHAMQDLRSGDTLIVALEPGALTEPAELTSLADQFSYATGHSDWAARPYLGLAGANRLSTLLALRPGSYHAFTLIGKLVQGRDLYRYNAANALPSGWLRTNVRLPLQGAPGHGPRLSGDARRYLAALKDWCARHGVRVAYSLPWAYAPADKIEEFKKHNARTLLQIAEFIPLLKDPRLGAEPRAELFADTAWHLNEEGSRLRTDQLGDAIRLWEIWPTEELQLFTGGEKNVPAGLNP